MKNTGCTIHAEARQMSDVERLAKELDAALDGHVPPEAICQQLRAAKGQAKHVLGQMVNAWRMFSADFRAQCSEDDRNLIWRLSDNVPGVIANNYFRHVRGIKLIEARRKASTNRGRVNIRLSEPFSDGARHEVHEIFTRKCDVDALARSVAALPNLGANDIASTIWAGRLYQGDFFRAAPHRLRINMLECLHATSPVVAQTFVAQILQDRSLPQLYRVWAWSEGVLRPHRESATPNRSVRWAYSASKEGRVRHVKTMADGRLREWLDSYAGGDKPARFDMERVLRGFKLSRGIIAWLVGESYLNILTYYLRECRGELLNALSLGEFAGCVCANERCRCTIRLLEIVEELSPGLIASFRDRNGAVLLEHLLYRYSDKEPAQHLGWLQMCFAPKSELHPLTAFLRNKGCKTDEPNGVGISWKDIENAAINISR